MLAPLRRSRTLALILVLLAPGITGSAVQWLHACPASSLQVSTDHQHHDPAQSGSGPAPTCLCIGACHTAGMLSASKPVTVIVAATEPDRWATPLSGDSFVPAGTPSHFLPPATAPPLS